jgi:dolichyl-phosphate beta-glucosyltransferase
MDLSMVIPAFNEAERISDSLTRIFRYLDSAGISAEVLVVDDGSTDGTAERVAEFKEGDRLRFIRLEENQGKGAAVRAGVLEASGDYILMSDADLSTPIQELEKLLPHVKGEYDIAVGSRQIEGAELVKRQGLFRQAAGLVFGALTRLVVNTGVIDTQCGFKCFRAQAAKRIFKSNRIRGYCFDIEVLAKARLWGMRVIEVPVRWEDKAGSKVNMIKDLPGVIKEILAIRRNISRGEYN